MRCTMSESKTLEIKDDLDVSLDEFESAVEALESTPENSNEYEGARKAVCRASRILLIAASIEAKCRPYELIEEEKTRTVELFLGAKKALGNKVDLYSKNVSDRYEDLPEIYPKK